MLQECSSMLTSTKAFQPSPGPVVSKKQPNIHCSDTLSFGLTELIDRKCFSVWGSLISTYWSCFVFLSNLCVISSHLISPLGFWNLCLFQVAAVYPTANSRIMTQYFHYLIRFLAACFSPSFRITLAQTIAVFSISPVLYHIASTKTTKILCPGLGQIQFSWFNLQSR